MTARRLLITLSSLLLALLASSTRAALAFDDAPQIAPFRTALVRIEGAISAQGQELAVQGAGEIDASRGASHLTIGIPGATVEVIVLDGRIYTRNLATGRWEYTEGVPPGSFDPAALAPYDPTTIRAAGRNFVRVGTEDIGGSETTHWRADADLARLLGSGAGLTTSSATMDLWVGNSDRYLHQLRIEGQSSASGAPGTVGLVRQVLTLTFTDFDAPIAIVAPPGAVPATPRAAGINGTPVGQATAQNSGVTGQATAVAASGAIAASPRPTSPTIDSTLLSRLLGAFSLLVLAAVCGLIVLHRRRQATRPRE